MAGHIPARASQPVSPRTPSPCRRRPGRPPRRARCVTPKSSSCGVPVSIVFIAASATAPSMQPPETEPAMRAGLGHRHLAAGRAEANCPRSPSPWPRATCSPAARQAAAVPSTSSTSVGASCGYPFISCQRRQTTAGPPGAARDATADRPESAGWPGYAPAGTRPHAAASRECPEILVRTRVQRNSGFSQISRAAGAVQPVHVLGQSPLRRRRGPARR